MADENASTVILNVAAHIFQITEHLLRLQAENIGPCNIIHVSAMLAHSAFSRPGETKTITLADKFKIGDTIFLDIIRDGDGYIPVQIRGMELYREDGTHVVGDGVIIDVTRTSGPVIRSVFVADFACQKERYQGINVEIRVGDKANFEALVTSESVEGLWLRQNSPHSNGSSFPIYSVPGIIQKSSSSGVISVSCPTSDGGTLLVPLYSSAYYGCGVPADVMGGERVICTVCSSQPRVDSATYQVIQFEPSVEGSLALSERLPPSETDGSRSEGENLVMRRSSKEVQCSRHFNEETMATLRASLLFMAEHSTKSNFGRFIGRYPKLVSILVEDMVTNGNRLNGDPGLVDGIDQRPCTPDFIPDESMLSSSTLTANADSDYATDQSNRGQSSLHWSPELEYTQREDSAMDDAATRISQFGLTEPPDPPSRRRLFDENSTLVNRLADHASIVFGGRTHISDWGSSGNSGAAQSSQQGQRCTYLGKLKPG